MNRRSFVRLTTIACGWGLFPAGLLRHVANSSDSVTFYVAGARFFRLPRTSSQDDPVVLKARRFKGQRCYAVCTASGEQIGWVPKALIGEVSNREFFQARLSVANIHAIPWKRYQVTVVRESLLTTRPLRPSIFNSSITSMNIWN